MHNPNDADNPAMNEEFHVGDTVHFKPVPRDEFDRPVHEPPTPLTVIRVGNSRTSFDYEVESPSGNRFYVTLDELAEGSTTDLTPEQEQELEYQSQESPESRRNGYGAENAYDCYNCQDMGCYQCTPLFNLL